MSNNYYKPNRILEDDVLTSDSRPEAVEFISDALRYHVPPHSGMGEIKYRNRYQYIQDKLKMLQDEFLCKIYRSDVEFMVYKCLTIADIDCYCRKIIYREWPDDIDVEVT